MCSLHAVLTGEFDESMEGRSGDGLWPVLVDHQTILASPIILDDHPRIAPESPGDLFDGGDDEFYSLKAGDQIDILVANSDPTKIRKS